MTLTLLGMGCWEIVREEARLLKPPVWRPLARVKWMLDRRRLERALSRRVPMRDSVGVVAALLLLQRLGGGVVHRETRYTIVYRAKSIDGVYVAVPRGPDPCITPPEDLYALPRPRVAVDAAKMLRRVLKLRRGCVHDYDCDYTLLIPVHGDPYAPLDETHLAYAASAAARLESIAERLAEAAGAVTVIGIGTAYALHTRAT